MTNSSSVGPFVSMCCRPAVIYPLESICYRNGFVALGADENIILPEIYDSNFSISAVEPSDFVRLYEFSCNGTTYDPRPTFYDLESYSPKNDLYYLMDNGSIYVNKSVDGGTGYWLSTVDYCFGSRMIDNVSRTVVSICLPRFDPYTGHGLRFLIVVIGMSISLPFLVATFIVYTILPELRNLPGSIFRCFVASVFLFFLLFTIDYSGGNTTCIYFLAILGHFAVLSTFFWMQVMSFDIWWTFRRVKSVQTISSKGTRKKFIIYSIYGWGCSALIPAVAVIIDSFPKLPRGIISPEISRGGRCGIIHKPKTAKGIYLYTPMAFSVISNTCFFLSTVINIARHGKDAARQLGGVDSQRHNDDKQNFNMYLKLFIVMGISWSMEFFTWQMKSFPQYVLDILDIPNALQGVIIFGIFVCKANVKRMLWKRLGWATKT